MVGAHVGAQSQQLDNHLHGENHGEDHVKDVHDGGEELRLLVMLDEKKGQRSGVWFVVLDTEE